VTIHLQLKIMNSWAK